MQEERREFSSFCEASASENFPLAPLFQRGNGADLLIRTSRRGKNLVQENGRLKKYVREINSMKSEWIYFARNAPVGFFPLISRVVSKSCVRMITAGDS
jgi:hypothetical protein